MRRGKRIGNATRQAPVGARNADDARTRTSHCHSGGLAAGNGTVMRVTPIGRAASDDRSAIAATHRDAEVTPADSIAGAASAAMCAALRSIGQRADLFAATAQHADRHERLTDALSAADRGDRAGLLTSPRALKPERAGRHSPLRSTRSAASTPTSRRSPGSFARGGKQRHKRRGDRGARRPLPPRRRRTGAMACRKRDRQRIELAAVRLVLR